MSKKCVVSTAVVLLSSCVGFASIGQTQSCMVAPGSWVANAGCVGSGAHWHVAAIFQCQMASACCGTIGFQYQTCTVGWQTQLSWCLPWPPCPHPCPPPVPPREQSCIARGGDATATATAISDNGSAHASAQAVGGDACVVISRCGNIH